MKKPRILIVEDEALIVEAIRRILHLAGCEQVDEVSCGEDAVKQAVRTNPDLILMDIHLAGKMDGIEAARSIHQHQNTPLIFLTGDSSDAIVELAKEAFHWGYLTKPFSPPGLLNAIEIALQKSREHAEQTDQLIQAKSQREEMLADFFENANELIQQVAPDGRLVYVNQTWRETLGYDASEISGLSLQNLIHPQDLQHCMDLFQRIMTGEQVKEVEVRFIKKDGGTVVLEGSSNCRFENGLPTLTRSIFHDVTERHRRQVRERIQANMRDAVWQMELDGDIKHILLSVRDGLLELDIAFEQCAVNVLERSAGKELMHFFNLTRECDTVNLFTVDSAVGAGAQLVMRFMQNAAPTYRPDLAESDLYGERENIGIAFRASVRSVLDVPFTHGTLAVNSYAPNAFSNDDIKTLEHLAKVLSEGFRRRDDLRRIRESEVRNRTLVAEKRQLQLEQSLMQSERMASVGTVAAGIVHNLKGLLQHILINAELLSMEYADAEETEEITATVIQMSQMIEDILAKSRQTKSPEAIDFNALVHRELDFLQAHPDFKHDVDKQVSLGENLPVTMGIYTDFSQVFGNLLRNAVDAMHDCDQKQLSVSTVFDGEYIMVEIADSGCGIPSSILPQLFEPFFTTKSSNGEDGKPMGTGLGLYTVRELLKARDATIEVESEVGQGTLFRVRIPVVL